MAIKHQPQSDKHPYASPTTPGLYIALRDYIIELVCLNVNQKIGPRFWSDKSYWNSKYKREVKGIANLGKELDLTDTLTQTALVQIIKEYHIKALIAKKTVVRVIKLTNNRITQLKSQRESLAEKQHPIEIDSKKNATFVDLGSKTPLARAKEIEKRNDD